MGFDRSPSATGHCASADAAARAGLELAAFAAAAGVSISRATAPEGTRGASRAHVFAGRRATPYALPARCWRTRAPTKIRVRRLKPASSRSEPIRLLLVMPCCVRVNFGFIPVLRTRAKLRPGRRRQLIRVSTSSVCVRRAPRCRANWMSFKVASVRTLYTNALARRALSLRTSFLPSCTKSVV